MAANDRLNETDVQAITKLAREGDKFEFKREDGQTVVFLFENGGYRQHDIVPADQLTKPAPKRIRQHPIIATKDSFVEYAKRFTEGGSRLFADINADQVVAVLDYHGPGAPANLDHRATMQLQLSEEWKRWNQVSGKLVPQRDFARWLEENMSDISEPDGADVLEVVKDLSAVRKVDFKSIVRLDNGDTEFGYAEETEARSKTGSIEVPTKFTIRIPVWYGEPTVNVKAFLRYRLDEGALVLGIELWRPVYVKQAAFEVIGQEIAERTSLPLHYGKVG